METSTIDFPLPGDGRVRSRAVRSGIALGRRAATVLGALPRAGKRLLDRVGTGLQRFDDNLWDGGDET